MYVPRGLAPALTTAQLERLRAHKYVSSGRSVIEPAFQLLWNWQVTLVPAYIHPNLLTLAGGMLLLSGLSTFIYHSPDMRQDIPAWCYLYNALCVFLYQSLDAIDGKHARKTGTSSVIGEIWDHGIDSLAAGALAVEFGMILKLGNIANLAFICILISMFSFFLSHWENYCTGLMQFGKFDVTETLAIFIICNLITAIFGQELWEFQVSNLFRLNELIILLLTLILTQNAIYKMYKIFSKKGNGPNGTTLAETSILTPVFPVLLMTVLYVCVFIKSKSKHDIRAKFFAYHMIFTVAYSKITTRLVVAAMSKSEFHFIESEFTVPAILFFNQYFGYLIPEHLSLIYLALLISIADFACYFIAITLVVSRNFNIPVLTVPQSNSRPEDKRPQNISTTNSTAAQNASKVS